MKFTGSESWFSTAAVVAYEVIISSLSGQLFNPIPIKLLSLLKNCEKNITHI